MSNTTPPLSQLAQLLGTSEAAAQTVSSSTKTMLSGILIPRPDNFTPPERTPWGGKLIPQMKKDLGVTTSDKVGESWEISGHPSFPNLVPFQFEGRTIEFPLNLIGGLFPDELYGSANVKRFGSEAPFLTKLLNSAENLSVQIHPDAEYAKRNQKWHSKTEMWVILQAEPGAGIFIGLTNEATEEKMRSALTAGKDISPYLNFVEVKPGDVFVIPAGTPHAIGAGILLLEQQETSETTFRYYDWGKLYGGKPRELHIEDALGSTNWDAARGIDGVNATLRRKPVILEEGLGNRARHEILANEKLFSYDRVVFDRGQVQVHENDASQGMHGLTVTEGQVFVEGADGVRNGPFLTGQSLLIPARMGMYKLIAPGRVSTTIYIGRSDPR